MILKQCGHVMFPSKHQLVNETFPIVVNKTMDKYVIPFLASWITYIVSFDLWIFCAGYDTFIVVVNFINDEWEFVHITMGILEVQNVVNVAMATQVKVLLNSFGLFNKVITYVKDEGSNLATLTFVLAFVVFCFRLQLPCPFVGFCFGHAMTKATQYAIDHVKMYFGFIEVNLKGS
jgi:hypothetical protein